MAITKSQQYKQMLRDGGVTEDIGFSIVKPSKDGSRPGYFSGQYGGGAGDRGGNPGASREENERAGRTDSGNRERAEERRRQQSQTNLPKSTNQKHLQVEIQINVLSRLHQALNQKINLILFNLNQNPLRHF